MSSFTDAQNLFTLLSNGQGDTNLFSQFYSDVMNVLGPKRWHTTMTNLTVSEGSPLVALPSTLLDLITVLYNGRFLSLLELREVEVLNSGWRNQMGEPTSYIEQAEQAQTIELYPSPRASSSTNATAIYVENRANSLPILTLPIALLILQREFVRESDHTDVEFGNLCGELGQLILEMLEAPENRQ